MVGLIVEFASAATTCPTLLSVNVFVNNRYVGSDGTFTVNVGDHVDIQVCCSNKMSCPATLSLTGIDGKTYTRTIKANKNKQCEMFYFQINSKLTQAKCVGPIKVISNCQNCGQTYTGSICIITKNPDCAEQLAKVYRLIDEWKADKVDLMTVIDAINEWANCGSAQGESAEIAEQKAQLMAMLQTKENLNPIPQCDSGYHLENGQCVPDIPQCDPGYHLENGQCVPSDSTCELSYVMSIINKWKANEATLSEVIDTINHWASSECTASSGLAPSAIEQQKAQLMAILQNPSNQVSQEEQQEWPSTYGQESYNQDSYVQGSFPY